MSLRREVFIALLQRKTLIETKNCTLKCLKRHYSTMRSMKNVAVFTEDGAFALFFRPHPGGFDSSRVPTPGNLPSKAKKMLMPGGQPGGALGAAGIDWCITTQTSRFSFSYSISYDKNFTPKHLDNTLTYTFCLNFTNVEPTVLEKKVPVNDFLRFPMPRIIPEVK